MRDNVKFCKNCNTTKENTTLFDDEETDFYAGYICYIKPEATQNNICPFCKNKLTDTIITEEEIDLLGEISNYDRSFLEQMIQLKETDIIEYNLKMSQFKANLSTQKTTEEKNKPHCPHCKSTNIKSISGLNRGTSIVMWGIFSKKINKSFECKSCGYTW